MSWADDVLVGGAGGASAGEASGIGSCKSGTGSGGGAV